MVWVPSRELVESACNVDIRYENPSLATHDGAAQQRQLLPELKFLRNHVVHLFGVKQTWMTGRTRVMRKGQLLDMHQSGRAVDFMVESAEQGNVIANYLLGKIADCGIQFIVWDHFRFSAAKVGAKRFGQYHGANPHTDHVHMELVKDPKPYPFYDGLYGRP